MKLTIGQKRRPEHRRGAPRALHVHAALVDQHVHRAAAELVAHRGQLERAAREATSPLERARLAKTLYDLDETLGALRYSPVTGSDSSDLPKETP